MEVPIWCARMLLPRSLGVFLFKSCFCDIVIFVISKFCNPMAEKETWYFNPLPLRDAFNTFANRADPDQAALVRAA